MGKQNKHFRNTCETGAIGVLLCLILGCGGDGIDRVVVTGSVTLKEKPVEVGQIRFIPQDGTIGPLSVAPIEQGHYRYDTKGGVPVGKHRVEILVWDPTVPEPKGPGEQGRPQRAEKYNKQSKLTATIEESDADVARDFQL